MIRIYEYDRRMADDELVDGKLRVISYEGDWAEGIESLRPFISPEGGPVASDEEIPGA